MDKKQMVLEILMMNNTKWTNTELMGMHHIRLEALHDYFVLGHTDEYLNFIWTEYFKDQLDVPLVLKDTDGNRIS